MSSKTNEIRNGILALIDIVNYSSQAYNMGDGYCSEYLKYFYEKINIISNRYKFEVVKTDGDAVLIFGTDLNGFLEMMLDLFHRERLENQFGFCSRFRMVAHSGYFNFKIEGGRLVDLVSADGIKVFRLEKEASSWELVVTHPLYQGLKSVLCDKPIEISRIKLNKPLKGFDNEDWSSPFFKLSISLKQSEISNLLDQMLDMLEEDVRFIPVFGRIYPSVPMENNFINLPIITSHPLVKARLEEKKSDKESRDLGSRVISLDLEEYNFLESPYHVYIEINLDMLNNEFNNGIICGLPGAGKTTILRNLAFKELMGNKKSKIKNQRIVLFVSCRNIPNFYQWNNQQYGEDTPCLDGEIALDFLTYCFLFGNKPWHDLSPKEVIEFQKAGKKVKKASEDELLTILIDALDETPDMESKEVIVEIFFKLALHTKIRVFLTARISEKYLYKNKDIPQFQIRPLGMEQIRQIARQIINEDSVEFQLFDEEIWRAAIVLKIAVTPLTALLVIAYFQVYRRFDHRFPMYDLLVKFILLKVWDEIKIGRFSYKNMEFFFEKVKAQDFLEKNVQIRILYDALASLCFSMYYKGKEGKIIRQVREETLLGYLKEFIVKEEKYASEAVEKDSALKKASHWVDSFRKEHLLVQSGAREYIFIHSTVMDFLAAYFLVDECRENIDRLRDMVSLCVEKEAFLDMDTLPLASGYSKETGFAILSLLKKAWNNDDRERFYLLCVKCLAEVEWMVHQELSRIQLKEMEAPIMLFLEQNRESVVWVYNYLRRLLLEKDKGKLEQSICLFDTILKLCRSTLISDILQYKSFDEGDAELIRLRKKLLEQLVQGELVDAWYESHAVKLSIDKSLITDNIGILMQLDSQVYHPDDKNYKFYQGKLGRYFIGFLGSPNLKYMEPIHCLDISPDGDWIISASKDGSLRLWESRTGKEKKHFVGHENAVRNCVFDRKGLLIVSASDDKTLKVWDVETGKEKMTLKGHEQPVRGCDFSPHSDRVVSASEDGTVRLWDLVSGKEIGSFPGIKGRFLSCKFSPYGEYVIACSSEDAIYLYEVSSRLERSKLIGHSNEVNSAVFSQDGHQILSAGQDGLLILWDIKSGKAIQKFKSDRHQYPVFSCAFSPSGKQMISTSSDWQGWMWEINQERPLFPLLGHQQAVTACKYFPGKNKKNTLATASMDGHIKIWDGEDGREILKFNGHTQAVRGCAFSPDGKSIASTSSDGTIRIWDVSTGREIICLTGHKLAARRCAFSPDNRTLITSSPDCSLKLWDISTGLEKRTMLGHSRVVWGCDFSPDGKLVSSSSEDNTIKLWDAMTGENVMTLLGHSSFVFDCAFSLDSKWLVSASNDCTLRIWDARTGQCVKTLLGHKNAIWSCRFSNNGKFIVSGSSDHTVRLWDVENDCEVFILNEHKKMVWHCVFLAGDQFFVSIADDFTLKVWETDSGRCLETITLLWQPFYVAACPVRPGVIIIANKNGTLTLFDLTEVLK